MTKSLVVGIGEQLANRYQILRKIGSGGMGDVYLAYDPLLEREVAIKLIQANVMDALIAERFKREARVVAKMDHSSIVPVYDTGTHNNCMFIVMPFVQGTTLRTLIDEKSLTFPEIITIGVQVAEALAYSHAQQVIHRDIKPENIMITKEETIRARVMDFGLAMTTSEKRITDSGLVMGTLCYLSPEQVTGMSIDGRTDIYALATVLYECFAGETPFSGEVYALLYSIAHKAPPPYNRLGMMSPFP